jgi:hypothetical protein
MTGEPVKTEFLAQCNILSELWMNYRNEVDFQDFIKYNDIGLPLAFVINEGIVGDPSEAAQSFVTEAFTIFVEALGIEDTGFSSLTEILKASGFEIE